MPSLWKSHFPLRSYFSTVGKDLASKFDSPSEVEVQDPIEYILNSVQESIDLPDTTYSEIRRLLSELDVKKSCGYDQISNKVLKETSSVIIPLAALSFVQRW